MRRLSPLFATLASLLLWGMAQALVASPSRQGVLVGETVAKLAALPLAVLEVESLPDGLDVDGDTGDLPATTPEAVFAVTPVLLSQEPARLADRRALTLVGIVVLVI